MPWNSFAIREYRIGHETCYSLGMNHDYLVYALCEPDAPTNVRYVGLTIRGIESRYKEHIDFKEENSHFWVNRWIAKLRRDGKVPVFRILESGFSSYYDLKEAEKGYIAQYRRLGYRLTNATDGGEGSWGFKHTPETRKILSEKAKLRPKRPYIPHSAETRKKISEKNKGKKQSPESRAKMCISRVGKTPSLGMRHTDEWKDEARNSKRAYWPIVDSDGVVYKNAKDAARTLGLTSREIRRAIKDGRTIRRVNKKFQRLPRQ